MTVTRQPPRGWAARLALAGLLALVGLSALAGPASAHANLVSTDPAAGQVLEAPPEQITLTFDETVTLSADGAQLYDATGARIDAEARSVDGVVTVRPAGEMADGTYVLTYRVISADSHPIAGSLSFSVGAPSEEVVTPDSSDATDDTVQVVLGVVQGISYAALFLAAGLAVFAAVLLPAGPGLEPLRQRLGRVLRPAAAVAVGGFVILVPVGVLYQQGLTLGGLATAMPWTGWLSPDGLVAALVALGLGVATLVGGRAPALGGAVLALGSLMLVGHTRSYGPAWLVITADVAHVATAAVWFGGLVGLVLSLPALSGRDRLAAATLARFSVLAGALLAVVAVAGTLLGWRILGSWQALFGTTYGLVLLAKVALVAVVAGVAAWNRYRLLPGVLGADGFQARRDAAARLRGAVRGEAGLLVVVLLLTGFLVNQVPREQDAVAAAPRNTVVAVADEVKVVAHLHPGRVGRNTVTVQVQDLAGNPVEPFAPPTVSMSSAGVDLGSRPVRNVGSGTYAARFVVPAPGEWTIQVSVRTGEFDNPVLTLDTTIR